VERYKSVDPFWGSAKIENEDGMGEIIKSCSCEVGQKREIPELSDEEKAVFGCYVWIIEE